ncbi:hypothetical protein [Paenibacillus sp. MMS18-CY102]|uniref:hypothetical protein n=1 Tax=Paenibacillus sp. MMS18-CY102 TaxID=2682849 RepID=UPI0013665C33|nr:hypothetical protein [Paenibacillus sp. MMS18-CY102]MWC26586.1 hypothetical protein [Paenibacillus sp. MMS18-CY102]
MNISQMMRSLLGDVQNGESRKLELKPGQVVRGVVLQTQGDQEAVVQINGVQVRAKLETPLSPGQTATLRVQPESTSGMIVLKPVDSAEQQVSDDTARQLMKAAGLPDSKWAMELVRDMKRDGIPMTREVAQALKQIFQAVPKGVDPAEWMQAAAASLKRGLPLTEQTVAAMRQVMFGKPLHVLMDTISQQLAQVSGADGDGMAGPELGEQSANKPALPDGSIKNGGAAAGAPSAPTVAALAARVKELLTQAASLQQQGVGEGGEGNDTFDGNSSKAPAVTNAKQATASDANITGRQATVTADGKTTAASLAAGGNSGTELNASAKGWTEAAGTIAQGNSEQSSNAALPGRPASAESGGWLGKMLQVLGVNHEHELLQETTRTLASDTAEGSTQNGNKPSSIGSATNLNNPNEMQGDIDGQGQPVQLIRNAINGVASHITGARPSEAALTAGAQASSEAQTDGDINAAGQLAKGQNTLVRQAGGAEGLRAPIQTALPSLPQSGDGISSETLKSALMSLASMDDAPAPLKETAQQLIQQITGQQLLLSPERNGSMLTHLTLFIPLLNQEGGQTASVHVQTKRGPKNELDASNCRLLFDLNLKSIGNTIVDVHVVDKIVNLNVWNDHPLMQAIALGERNAVASALQQAGYQLLTFKVTAMPDESITKTSGSNADGTSGGDAMLPPTAPSYGAKPYKGVDFRI